MQTTIQSIHFEADEKLKQFVTEKVAKIDQFYDNILSKEVTLKKLNKDVENSAGFDIIVRVPNQTLVASETGPSYEAATDMGIDNIVRQLKRFKEKTRARV